MKSPPCALRRIATVGCMGLLGSCGAPAGAQSLADFHAGHWEGSLGLGYLVDHEKLQSGDGMPPTRFDRRRWSEELTLANQGYFFVDPRLATGLLSLSLGLVQDHEGDDKVQTRHGSRLLGYELDSTFLSGLPYNARLFAHRNQAALTQPFGHTDSTFQNLGASLHLREDSPLRDKGFPYLSANLAVEQRRTSETTTSVLGQSFHRDETQNTVSLDGHKGFETADLDTRYQFTDLRDAAFPQTDFQSHTVAGSYSFDFGPTLNRRSDSRVFLYRRNGVSPTTLMTGSEDLSIAHWDNLSTGYRYSISHSQTQAGPTTAQDASSEVRYKPFRNLETNGEAFASREELSVGTREGYGAGAGLRYRHDLPWGAKLDAHGTSRYRIDENRLSASILSVIDEAQSAPASLGAGAGFQLVQSFVILSSIKVVDVRGGARVPATPDVDYDVVLEGNRIRIVPLPTSALIAPNDPLAVSYSYELDPSIKFSTASRSAGFGLALRWIDFAYDRDVSNETLLGGQDNGFLQDARRDVARIDLHGSWKAVDSRTSATHSRYDSQRLAYVENRYTGLLSWRPSRNVSFIFNAERASTDFSLPAHRTRTLSEQLSLDWRLRWGFSANALIARRVYQDTLQPAEVINEARLGARLNYGKLSIVSSLTGAQRDRGGSRTSDWGFDVNVGRRF